jgi:hypothetical protein
MKISSTSWAISSLTLGMLSLSGTTQAAGMFSQSPCVNSAGYCQTFTDETAIPTIRSFTFNLPRASSVQATLHGTLYCGLRGSFGSEDSKVIDLVSQILTDDGAVSVNGPGALRHVGVPYVGFNTTQSMSFNLASTRVINYTSGGNKTLRFKISKSRMDSQTVCFVYHAAFSVVYTP